MSILFFLVNLGVGVESATLLLCQWHSDKLKNTKNEDLRDFRIL